MKKLHKIGMAIEAVGVTITTCGIADMTQWVLIAGVIFSAIGRGVTMYAKD